MKSKYKISFILVILFFIGFNALCQDSIRSFELTDTSFEIGAEMVVKNLHFDMSRGYPIPESYPVLDSIVEFLNKNKNIKLEISVHSDNRPISMTNDTLTLRRAENIEWYIVRKGIDSERLIPIGYGSKFPFIVTKEISNKYNYLPIGQILDKTFIDSLENREQREKAHEFNRRTVIKIVQNE